jgi:hypothetical protein
MQLLRDDAEKVNEALAALKAHDEAMHAAVMNPGATTPEQWGEVHVQRRRLSAVLEERAGILARLVLVAHP